MFLEVDSWLIEELLLYWFVLTFIKRAIRENIFFWGCGSRTVLIKAISRLYVLRSLKHQIIHIILIFSGRSDCERCLLAEGEPGLLTRGSCERFKDKRSLPAKDTGVPAELLWGHSPQKRASIEDFRTSIRSFVSIETKKTISHALRT